MRQKKAPKTQTRNLLLWMIRKRRKRKLKETKNPNANNPGKNIKKGLNLCSGLFLLILTFYSDHQLALLSTRMNFNPVSIRQGIGNSLLLFCRDMNYYATYIVITHTGTPVSSLCLIVIALAGQMLTHSPQPLHKSLFITT